MSEQEPFRILIVDDHRLARESIRTALRFFRFAPIEIVGEAADAGTGLELARKLWPDVITVDIGLPDVSGLDLTRRLKAEVPAAKIVVVTASSWQEAEAAKAGAAYYVTKDRLVEDLPRYMESLVPNRS